MPSHHARGRQLTGRLAPGLEPLEDRLLLSGSATVGATHVYSHPQGSQPPADPYQPAVTSRVYPWEGQAETLPATASAAAAQASRYRHAPSASPRAPAAPRYDPDAYPLGRTDVAAATYSAQVAVAAYPDGATSKDYFEPHTGCPEAPRPSSHPVDPLQPSAGVAVAAPASPAPPDMPPASEPVDPPRAARVAAQAEQPVAEEPDDTRGEPPAEPGANPEEEDEEVTAVPLIQFDAPALDLGDWNQAARQFLQALETLAGDPSAPEAFWVRLGLWGLAAATTAVMFELVREHLIKRRVEALDLTLPRGLWEYDFTPR